MNVNIVASVDVPLIENHQNITIDNLDNIPANVCTSLVLNETLGYLTNDQVQLLLGKVRHQGVVSINCPDAMETATQFCWGNIDLAAFSMLTANRRQQHTLLSVRTILEQNGYTIETATTNNLAFYIRAKRP